jgi:hypothetical protein
MGYRPKARLHWGCEQGCLQPFLFHKKASAAPWGQWAFYLPPTGWRSSASPLTTSTAEIDSCRDVERTARKATLQEDREPLDRLSEARRACPCSRWTEQTFCHRVNGGIYLYVQDPAEMPEPEDSDAFLTRLAVKGVVYFDYPLRAPLPVSSTLTPPPHMRSATRPRGGLRNCSRLFQAESHERPCE